MSSVDSYREAIELIVEYISKKHGQEDVSIINMILETKGIPKVLRGVQYQQNIQTVSEGLLRTNGGMPLVPVFSNGTVRVQGQAQPVQVPVVEGILQKAGAQLPPKGVSASAFAPTSGTHLPNRTVGGNGTAGSFASLAPPSRHLAVSGSGAKGDEETSVDSEEVGEKIRDILRSANSVDELNKAISMAKSAGLTYEANLGERKLKKLLC